MIKTILVAATGNESDAATFAAALAIARPCAAHLDMLHVRLDPVTIAVAMSTDAGGGALTTGLIEQLERDSSERERKAQEIFTRFCGAAGLAVTSAPTKETEAAPSAEWHVETGEEPRWMATYGVASDLILLPRAIGEEVLGRATLEAVLLEAGRPILIPAATAMPANFERIAIAWKPTPQAARAVAAAMPFLTRAREIHHRGGSGRGAPRGARPGRPAGAKPRLAWPCGDNPTLEARVRGRRRNAVGRRGRSRGFARHGRLWPQPASGMGVRRVHPAGAGRRPATGADRSLSTATKRRAAAPGIEPGWRAHSSAGGSDPWVGMMNPDTGSTQTR